MANWSTCPSKDDSHHPHQLDSACANETWIAKFLGCFNSLENRFFMSDVSIMKHLLGQVEQVCGPLLKNGWNPQKETKEAQS